MSDEDPTSDAETIDSLEELVDGETYHYVHAERGDDSRTFRVDRRHADADDFAGYGEGAISFLYFDGYVADLPVSTVEKQIISYIICTNRQTEN